MLTKGKLMERTSRFGMINKIEISVEKGSLLLWLWDGCCFWEHNTMVSCLWSQIDQDQQRVPAMSSIHLIYRWMLLNAVLSDSAKLKSERKRVGKVN